MERNSPMPTTGSTSLRCLTWNIRGVATRTQHKLRDKEVLHIVQQHDIIGILESHTENEEGLEIEGYGMAHNPRKTQLERLGKNYGGVILYYKKEKLPGLEIIQPYTPDCIWAKWQDEMENVTILGIVYVPPGEAMIHDPFKHVRAGLLRAKQDARILLMGDMNARVGDCTPNKEEKVFEYVEYIPEEDMWDEIKWKRTLRDKQLNTYGREVKKIATGSGLECVNGTCIEKEPEGNFTCYTGINHPTILDHAWCTAAHKDSLINFQVLDFMPDVSDHCPISLEINTARHPSDENTYSIGNKNTEAEQMGMQVKMIKTEWTEAEKELVSYALSQEINTEIGKKIMHKIANSTAKKDINIAVSDLNSMIINTMEEQCSTWAVRKPNPMGEASKPDQPWFKQECERAKAQLRDWARQHKRSDLSDDPTYYGLQTNYRQVKRRAEKLFRQQIMNKMAEKRLKDPRKWWILLRRLNSEPAKRKLPREINIKMWANHFEKLLNSKPAVEDNRSMTGKTKETPPPYFLAKRKRKLRGSTGSILNPSRRKK